MQLRVLILLIFALLVTIFAVMNTQFVQINFLLGKTSIQLIFVILFSLLIGALLMFILASMKQLKLAKEIKGLRKENLSLKADNSHLTTEVANYKAKDDEGKTLIDLTANTSDTDKHLTD